MATRAARIKVGIDIEAPRRLGARGELLDMAHSWLPYEVDRLAQLPLARQPQALLHIWTAKESVLKALGCGLLGPVRELQVQLDADCRPMGIEAWCLAAWASEVAVHGFWVPDGLAAGCIAVARS